MKNAVIDEIKKFSQTELKSIDIKIVLMTANAFWQIVKEHSKKKKTQDPMFEVKILKHNGIVDNNVVKEEYDKIE